MACASTRLALALSLFLAPAVAVADEITLTISGVSAADTTVVLQELGKIDGVSKVAVRKLKDRQATVTVEFKGKGGDLALKLGAAGGALKNVKEFDDASVLIEFGGAPAPKGSGSAAEAEKAKAEASPSGADAPPAKADGGARRIPGGTAQTFQGVAFDLPKNWKAQASDQGTVLAPEGANPEGLIEEFYCLLHDPDVKSLDGDAFIESVETFVGTVQPGAERAGAPKKEKYGGRDGRLLLFKCQTPDGRVAEVRVYGFMGANCGCAFVALGFPDKLAARNADVQAILGSFGAPGKAAAGAGGGAGGVRPELVGQWAWLSSLTATGGGGASSSRVLTLQPDGTYTYTGESSASGNVPGGTFGTASQTGDSGTWTATDGSITFRSRDGETKTYRLDKRNHPKNVNDPMIVLDGQPFVTTTQRAPW